MTNDEPPTPIVPVRGRHITHTIDLLELERDQLREMLNEWGQPRYRADQVWRWIYADLSTDPGAMTNLPKSLRARLAGETRIGSLTPVARQQSQDGETIKWLFASSPPSEEPVHIETVLMNYERRRTVCISTQAGCGMGCSFCATGQMGLQRNLSAGEIVAQVHFVGRELANAAREPAGRGQPLSNVVLMGMGEPLANYDATLAALRRLTDPAGLNLGQRRISLSTVGLPAAIERFSREGLQVNLVVSLHAATNKLRDELLPINRRYPISQVLAACRAYVAHTKRRVSFEWALIKNVNDDLEQARALARLLRGLMCHVNLIPLNPTDLFPGAPSPPERVDAFCAELESHGIPTTVRVRRGIDIQAGCGQLREREVRTRD